MRDFWRTIKLSKKYKGLTFLVLVFGILSTCVGLIGPYLVKLFFDLVEAGIKTGFTTEIKSLFVKYTVYFTFFTISGILVERIWLHNWTKWKAFLERGLSVDVFDHLEHLSLDFFSKRQSGKIIEQITNGVEASINFISSVAFNFLPQGIFFIVATIILMRIDYRFGLIIALGIPLYVGITSIFNKVLRNMEKEMRLHTESMSGIRNETIQNIRSVKAYSQEASQLNKFKKVADDLFKVNMNWSWKLNYQNTLRGFVYYASQYAALALGVYFVLLGKITIGTFILVWTYVNRAYEPMWYLLYEYDKTVKDLQSVKRLFKVLDTKSTVIDSPNAKTLRVKSGLIKIESLKFEYAETDKILNGINLEIPAQKTVAIVGKSGSGKTTLAKLLMRFHDVTNGRILIDGVDIRDVTQKSLRENIGYVLQDSLLFNDTVTNNIRFGRPKAKESDVIKAAKMANADEFIVKLPNGYKTIVGERGVKLSGGEQQRINIARALLKDAPILILDEATSSLDSESEIKIQDALYKLIKGKTTIIIAHRLSTVMRADLIVVMDKGKIVEQGTHQDLVEHKGIYSKLFEIQSGGYLDTIDSELVEKEA